MGSLTIGRPGDHFFGDPQNELLGEIDSRMNDPTDDYDFDEPERSASGAPIWRHERSFKEFTPAFGNEETINRITRKIEKVIAPIKFVHHEILSHLVHVDIHVIEPGPERPYQTLFTTGMSDLPMTVPRDDVTGKRPPRFAELMLCLPPDWPSSEKSNDDYGWPVRLLNYLARMPHQYDTWLGWGHTVPNGDPPGPLGPTTPFTGVGLTLPALWPKSLHRIRISEKKAVRFFAVLPLHTAEMDYKLEFGMEALLDLFNYQGINELIDPERPSVVPSS